MKFSFFVRTKQFVIPPKERCYHRLFLSVFALRKKKSCPSFRTSRQLCVLPRRSPVVSVGVLQSALRTHCERTLSCHELIRMSVPTKYRQKTDLQVHAKRSILLACFWCFGTQVKSICLLIRGSFENEVLILV